MVKARLCLWDLPLFETLDREQFSRICSKALKKHYQRGEFLCRQGEPADTLFLIKEGRFKMVRINEEGKEIILHVAGPGEVLGEGALFREGLYPTDVIALEKARVCAFNRSALEELLLESPELAPQVIHSLGKRLYDAWEQATELRTGSTRERILNLFLRLASEHGEPCEEGTLIKAGLTQQEIADYIGTSRVMVAQALKELAEKNYLVRREKHYILRDRCF